MIEKDHPGDWSPDKDCPLTDVSTTCAEANVPYLVWGRGKAWLLHRLSKHQSQTTVLLRTPITQMIFFNQGMLLLGWKNFLINNIEGKITECWLVNEESIFSKFCFVKRAKLVIHNWSSGCLATAYSIKKLFSCNNGILFHWWGIYRRIKGHERKWKQEE